MLHLRAAQARASSRTTWATASSSTPRRPTPPQPTSPKDAVTLGGCWTTSYENFTAGADATTGLHYSAKKASVVLGGQGTATVEIDGVATRSFAVSGSPTIYPLIEEDQLRDARLRLSLTPGLQAYVFTFG